MKKENYKGKTDKDLEKALKEAKESLQKFRFGMSGSKTKNVKESYSLRKTVARIKTEMNSRINSSVNS